MLGANEREIYVLQMNSNMEHTLLCLRRDREETLYANGTDLKVSAYGRSVKLWGNEGTAVVKTKDRSVHLISGGKVQWTQVLSLSFPQKIIEHEKGFIVCCLL